LISSVSHFSLGVEALFGGLLPQKVPCGDGTEFWAPVSLDSRVADIFLIRIMAYSG